MILTDFKISIITIHKDKEIVIGNLKMEYRL